MDARVTLLRSVLLGLKLEEAIKWKAPVYVNKEKIQQVYLLLKIIVACGFFKVLFLVDDKNCSKMLKKEKQKQCDNGDFII